MGLHLLVVRPSRPDRPLIVLVGPEGSPADSRSLRPPSDQRVIARHVPEPAGEQAKIGQDPNWRYSAFTTNTQTGQIQWLDARHRTQAHVEDQMKEIKAWWAENLPSKDWDRNSAWLHLTALATSLNAWLRHIDLDGDLARAEPKALRYRIFGAPARHVIYARRTILKIPPSWTWSHDLTTVFACRMPCTRLKPQLTVPTNSTTHPSVKPGAPSTTPSRPHPTQPPIKINKLKRSRPAITMKDQG